MCQIARCLGAMQRKRASCFEVDAGKMRSSWRGCGAGSATRCSCARIAPQPTAPISIRAASRRRRSGATHREHGRFFDRRLPVLVSRLVDRSSQKLESEAGGKHGRGSAVGPRCTRAEVASPRLRRYYIRSVTYQPITIVDSSLRERLARYFEPPGIFPYLSLAMGAALGLLFAIRFGIWVGVAAAVVGMGGFGFVAYRVRMLMVVTDREFDKIADHDFGNAAVLALQRFQLEPSDLRYEACRFRTPTTKRDVGTAFKGQKLGRDKKPRSSPHEFTIINFGHERLFLFRCVFDLTTGSTLYEECRDFAYRDVLSVEREMQRAAVPVANSPDPDELSALWQAGGTATLRGIVQSPGKQTLRVRLSSGELIELVTLAPPSGGTPSEQEENGQRLLKLLRILIK